MSVATPCYTLGISRTLKRSIGRLLKLTLEVQHNFHLLRVNDK